MITKDIPNNIPSYLRGMATFSVANIVEVQIKRTLEVKDYEASCCFRNYVFGETVITEDWKNDKYSEIAKRILSTDTVVFTLQRNLTGTWVNYAVIVDDTYGEFYNFGDLSNADLTGFIVDWQKVLTLVGAGNYRLKTDTTIIGVSDEILSPSFVVREYDEDLADMTIRIEWYLNSNILNAIDYGGLNWYNSFRYPGFFGDTQDETENINYKDSDYESFNVRRDITRKYNCEIGWMPQCMDEQLDFIKQADRIVITDSNLKNYDYSLNQKELTLDNIDETQYDHIDRLAKFNLKFNDKVQNRIKKLSER